MTSDRSTAARLALNTLSSYARLAIVFGVFFVTTPVFIRSVGESDYGLWSLVTSALGFFSLLDCGLGVAVIKYVAQGGEGAPGDKSRILSTFWVIYLAISLVSAACLGLFSLVFNSAFDVPAGHHDRAVAILWILGARMAILALPLSLFRGVLFGQERLHAINVIQIVASVLNGAGILAAARLGLSVVAVSWIALGAMLVEHAAYVALVYRGNPGLRLRPSLVDRAFGREVFSLSAAQLLVNASGLVLLRMDPIIIKLYLPLSAVTAYAIPARLAENALYVVKQIAQALSPVVARVAQRDGDAGVRAILLTGTRAALVPAALIAVSVLAFSDELLRFWLKRPAFDGSGPVLVILTIAMMMLVPQQIASAVFTYSGMHWLSARLSVLTMLVNLIMSFALVRALGLVGVALGTFIATVAIDVIVVLKAVCDHYKIRYRTYGRAALFPAVWPIVPSLGALLALKRLAPPAGLADVFLSSALGAAIYLALFWWLGNDVEERRALLERLRPPRAAASREAPSQ